MTITPRAVTHGPHHFFGYYDKCPWNHTSRYLLALQTPFMDRRPGPDDEAVIGLVDWPDDHFHGVAATRAWNWQQGCMAQWLPDDRILFNDRGDKTYVTRILDPFAPDDGDRQHTLPLPVQAVRPDGIEALSLNYGRMHDTRPGYGYAALPDPWRGIGAPEDDGIWRMNLQSGEHELILPLSHLASIVEERGYRPPDGAIFWINHANYNPSGTRFVFLLRCGNPSGKGVWWTTWMFTANADGSDLHLLSDHGMVSHYDWRDDAHLLAWAHRKGQGDHFFLFTDRRDETEIVGGDFLTVDGHCSYSPDRRWILSDAYPNRDGERALLLWNVAEQRGLEVGRFYGPTPSDVEIRCDLHARWSRDGKQVCFDSIHDGTRQMHVLDMAPLLD